MSSAGVHSLFDSLWRDYTAFNPRAKRIYDLILERERRNDPTVKALVNDHVALRTFDVAPVGLEALSALFQRHGYRERGEYSFEEKKLYARHLEPDDDRWPKVFISELEARKFSTEVQTMVAEVIAKIPAADVKNDAFLWSGRRWEVDYRLYQRLLQESEYAAWVYAFGFRANHFTIFFNHLKTFDDLGELNEFVRAHGYALNAAGGEIKGSPALFLEQSSTLAETVKVRFKDGEHEIPSCYYEFARRYPLPDGSLYQGFVTTSADKIFESTNTRP